MMYPDAKKPHIGTIFIERQLLRPEEVQAVLRCQKEDPSKPFGQLARALFGVNHEDVEDAWVQQSTASFSPIDPLTLDVDQKALDFVGSRRAWQFGILPVRLVGEGLQAVTTTGHFRRATGLIEGVLEKQSLLAITTIASLAESLRRHLPFQNLGEAALRATEKLPFGDQ